MGRTIPLRRKCTNCLTNFNSCNKNEIWQRAHQNNLIWKQGFFCIWDLSLEREVKAYSFASHFINETNEPEHDKTNKMTREDSDQPSLISLPEEGLDP